LSAANHVQVVAVVEACSSYLQVWLILVWNTENVSVHNSVCDVYWYLSGLGSDSMEWCMCVCYISSGAILLFTSGSRTGMIQS
jgi:hypothetical protein